MFGLQDGLPKACLEPKSPSEIWVVDLETIIDADGLPSLRSSGCCHERQVSEESDVGVAERTRPKVLDEDHLVWTGFQRLWLQVCHGQLWFELWP